MKRKTTVLLALLILFIIVILTFIGFFYFQTIETNNQNLETLAKSQLSYGSKRMLIGQKTIEDNASTILVDSNVKKLRNAPGDAKNHDYLTEITAIKEMLKQRLINGSEMSSISIYWPQKDILIATETNLLVREEMKNRPVSGKEWRGTSRGTYFFMDYSFGNVLNDDTIVAIGMSDKLLLDTEEAVSLDSSETVLIMPNNQIFGGTQTFQEIVMNNLELFSTQKDNTAFRIAGNKGKFIKVVVPNSNVTITKTIPPISTNLTYTKNTVIIFGATLFVLCFGFTLIFLFYRNVISEISLLTTKLKAVEKGDYDTRITHLHKNEFDYLFTQFNQMVSSIQKLLQSLTKEMKQRELAEERQFQSQIQPHFLYNSLFYIVSVAYDPKAVMEMTRHLTEYYRYLTKKSDITTIQEEVSFARHYLTIQALRKEFHFNIEVDDCLLEEPILPLLIQPIIENAIEHGIEAKDGARLIELKIKKEGEINRVSVSDDGPGMTDANIENLIYLINSPSRSTHSVGLWNVNQRLINYYGRQSKLTIQSNTYGGLLVTFKFKQKMLEASHEIINSR